MRLIAVGLSFHSAPLGLRERAVVSASEGPALLRYIASHPGLTGAAVLSTCNRTDFYLSLSADAVDEVAERLGTYLDPGNPEIAQHLVTHVDDAAIEHMCRVASGLDSMVIGEAQVLGQFRAAHRLAADAGTLSVELDLALRGAIETAKRVRTQTSVGRGTASLSEVAIDIAETAIGKLAGRGVLLVGAGKMSRTAARRLREVGTRVLVTSRSESARRLASELGADAISREDVGDAIVDIDLVITSTSAPTTVISARDVAMWQGRRHGRPLCIVDLAVPRDVEAAAADVPGVRLVDIDEIGAVVESGIATRRLAVPEATAIVASDVIEIIGRVRERSTGAPVIAAMVQNAERLRRDEVERALGRLGDVDPALRTQIDAMTQALVRRLLHAPIGYVRGASDDPTKLANVREIFDVSAAPADSVGDPGPASDHGDAVSALTEEAATVPNAAR